MPKRGVGITTHNRRDVFNECIKHWLQHRPDDCTIVVVDDGSDIPVPPIPGVRVIRHEYAKGIAMAKNKCLAELSDCEHIWLSDDDTWCVVDGWNVPYEESPQPHLMFQWVGRGRHRLTHDDGQHFALGFPRGVMLYVERRVVDVVGGMNTSYGAHGGEHVEFSQRIHDVRLTHYPFADVKGSHQLWYSRDKSEGNGPGSSRFTVPERRRMCEANGKRWGYRFAGWPHFPYREGGGVQDWSLGPRLAETFEGTLDHVLGLRPFGVAVEFGVGEGHSLRRIAKQMPAWGFDSWKGLPERWREGFDAGMFACAPPALENATLVQGWFADTLPRFDFAKLGPVGLWHIDADLYSSTVTILDHIEPHLLPGTYIVMDEYHGYPGADGEHEQLAFREWAQRSGWGWTVVGHGPEQWAIRLV